MCLLVLHGRLSPGKGHDPGQSGESFGNMASAVPQVVGPWVQQPPALLGLQQNQPVNKSVALRINMLNPPSLNEDWLV